MYTHPEFEVKENSLHYFSTCDIRRPLILHLDLSYCISSNSHCPQIVTAELEGRGETNAALK